MKAVIKIFMLSLLLTQTLIAQESAATSVAPAPGTSMGDELFSPKVKAFLVVSGYGTAGGALLGLASMAFGEDGKAIARGAALGLYAGILFGAYILYTHEQMKNQYNTNPYPTEEYNPRDYSTSMRSDINVSGSEVELGYFESKMQQNQATSWQVPVASFRF